MGAIQNYNDFEIKHPKIKSLKQRFVRGSYAYSGKASTKLRPIWDQSQTSPGEAIAPNSYWMRGGNVANLSRIFTFFRAGTYISTADIKKAFYGFNVSLQDAVLSKIYLPIVKGTLKDKNGPKVHFGRCKKCVDKKESCAISFEVFLFSSAVMGQKQSPSALKLVLARVGQLFAQGNDIVSIKAREYLRDCIYFDDLVCHGSTPAELEAVKAKMTSALSQASFSLHPWINYSTPPEDFTLPKWPKSYLDKLIPDEIGYQYCAHCLGGFNDENIYSKNLGLKVCTICDYATLTCNVNLSAKKRGRYEKPCLKKGENIEEYVKNVGKLSKRIFARFVASLWDLTGYYGPIVLIARLAFRQAIMTEEKALGWDDNLSDSAQQLLINALTRIYEGHGSSMARNLVPRKGYVKNAASPLLCICVDSG